MKENEKDLLEEEELVEVCKNCNSLDIREEVFNEVKCLWCKSCGTTDYIKVMKLEEYLELIEKQNG